MNQNDSWKSNTFVNFHVQLALVDTQTQFLTSHAIFNYHAYAERVYQIIFYKSSSFSIGDVTSQDTSHAQGFKTQHL
jgi:hypothetical protein